MTLQNGILSVDYARLSLAQKIPQHHAIHCKRHDSTASGQIACVAEHACDERLIDSVLRDGQDSSGTHWDTRVQGRTYGLPFPSKP